MTATIGIVQSLANEDPDVDAIYRLTQPLPFDFTSKGFNVAVPKGAYAPYNAQATLHLYNALWSLMLPVTIHGRVSDIWRGYAAQRIMSMLNLRLLFSPSLVKQVRNEHNYLADFDSENDLYLRSQKLLEQLEAWQPTSIALKSPHPLCAVIEELWIMLYEHGYVLMGDIDLTQAWLKSLLSAGYKFPILTPEMVSATKRVITPTISKLNTSAISKLNTTNTPIVNITQLAKVIPTAINGSKLIPVVPSNKTVTNTTKI